MRFSGCRRVNCLPTSRCHWRSLVGSFYRFSLRYRFNSPGRERACLFELFPTPENLLITRGFYPAKVTSKTFECLFCSLCSLCCLYYIACFNACQLFFEFLFEIRLRINSCQFSRYNIDMSMGFALMGLFPLTVIIIAGQKVKVKTFLKKFLPFFSIMVGN